MNRRLFALFLIFAFLISGTGTAFAVPKGPEVFMIRSSGDFMEFAESCAVDSWSEGRRIELVADIDMSMEHYVPAAIFKGVFEGNGHTVSGILIEASGSVLGLFRYNDGEIRNVTVDMRYSGSGTGTKIGGIAGVNRGYIEECTVFGNINASSICGGIAGENSGEISECYFGGAISAEHYSGGIAGKNTGIIIDCSNAGRINTELLDNSLTDVSELLNKEFSDNLSSLITTEDLSIVTDIGGIAGINTGKIISCSNKGSVGYSQVGYNVGGIAGRSEGNINGCENRGIIQGRKDVGGIAGHAQPAVRAENSLAESLRNELNGLHSKIDILLNNANESSDEVSSQIQAVFGNLDSAIDNGYEVANGLTNYINSNTEEINDLAVRIDTAEELLNPAITKFSRASRDLNSGMNSLDKAMNELVISDEITSEDKSKLKDAVSTVNEQNQRLTDAVNLITWVLKAAYNDRNDLEYTSSGPKDGYYILSENRPVNWRETIYSSQYTSYKEENLLLTKDREEFTTQDICKIEDELSRKVSSPAKRRKVLLQAGSEAADAGGQIAAASGDILSVLNKYYFTEDENGHTRAERIGENVTDMTDHLSDASYYFSQGMKSMEDFNAYISGNDPASFVTLGNSYRSNLEELKTDLSDMTDNLSSTELALNDAFDLLFTDMQAVNNQFNRVMMVIVDILDYLSNPITEDTFTDESEKTVSNNTAISKITLSVNRGSISGESNVGGIAGSMSFETDFNLIEDIQTTIDIGISSNYFTHCIAMNCDNYGIIDAKNSAGGGIAGFAESGAILSCNNYGNIHCLEGTYCGGIAGISDGVIRNCFAKGNLSAASYLGGIAGKGKTISDCGSVVQLESASECVGAIAGNVNGEGEVLRNFFNNESVGGIDGISYKDGAFPVSYEEMMALKNIPQDFDKFTLYFVADEELVHSLDFHRGDSISEKELPKVPEKDGFIGSWEDYDYEDLLFSDTVKAVYIPLTAVISSEELSEGKAIALADGSFGTDSRLRLLECDYPAPENVKLLYRYRLSLEDVVPGHGEVKIHTLVPEGGGQYSVYIYADGIWNLVSSKEYGSYLVFGAPSNTFDYCVVDEKFITPLALYGSLGLISAGALAAALVKLLKKRKKNRG